MFIILFEYIYITRVLFRTLFKKMYLNLLFLTLLETNLTDTCIYTPIYRLIATKEKSLTARKNYDDVRLNGSKETI